MLLASFWLASRYPQLVSKAHHVGNAVSSMAWASEVVTAPAGAPLWERIAIGALNWLAGMRVGMTFGVLLGALVHTALRYYPLRIGRNIYLNSIKGALVGMPAGICANCSVPAACGLVRGRGRVEVALGFLFSSPNFNPVVIAMTFTAMPLAMAITKYAVLVAVISLGVPLAIRWLDRERLDAVERVANRSALGPSRRNAGATPGCRRNGSTEPIQVADYIG